MRLNFSFWFCRVSIGGKAINSSVYVSLSRGSNVIFHRKPAVNTVLSKYHDVSVSLEKYEFHKDDRIARNTR